MALFRKEHGIWEQTTRYKAICAIFLIVGCRLNLLTQDSSLKPISPVGKLSTHRVLLGAESERAS